MKDRGQTQENSTASSTQVPLFEQVSPWQESAAETHVHVQYNMYCEHIFLIFGVFLTQLAVDSLHGGSGAVTLIERAVRALNAHSIHARVARRADVLCINEFLNRILKAYDITWY